uniref:GDP/GTP exchange factor Sec2 N-terminal domain-containing protein n=1 Tax=Mycena chlorophos TaxID=658473 RepID=A0ABQ0M4F6_MYCCL|nr:predicted protein [Mycena chlorophos]
MEALFAKFDFPLSYDPERDALSASHNNTKQSKKSRIHNTKANASSKVPARAHAAPKRPPVSPTSSYSKPPPPPRRPSFSTLISDLEAIRKEDVALISDLRGQLKASNQRYLAEHERLLSAHEEYSDLEQQTDMRVGKMARRNERLAEQLEAAKQLAQALETQLSTSQIELQATEMFLEIQREDRDQAEAELKTLKEGIEAREEGVRQAQERLDERGYELLQALEKSKDALLQGISGSQAGKRKEHEQLTDDSRKLKKAKTTSNLPVRSLRLRLRSEKTRS